MRKALLILLALALVTSVFVSCNNDPKTVTVTFNPGNAEGEPYTQTVVIGVSTKLTENKFKNEGYGLVGWSLSPTGGHDYDNEEEVTLTSDLNLFAVWSKLYYIHAGETEEGTVTPIFGTYMESDKDLFVSVRAIPKNDDYYLSAVNLNGSENKAADFYDYYFKIFIPRHTTGDITINPTFTEKPASVNYLKAEWNGTEVVTSDQSCTVYSLVHSYTTYWKAGWYVVKENNVEIAERITVSGDVNLIIYDGATLEAIKGISVREGSSLTIYGQTGGTGKLEINGVDYGNAGIGSDKDTNCGTINICGGNIITTGGEAGAGIGGGEGHSGGIISVCKGAVVATGGKRGAGIGGGDHGEGGTINLYGGTVNASSANGGAGIGGGQYASGGTITISGATVNSQGGDYSAGIGGGEYGHGGTVTITAGSVTAKGTREAAGIGGGYHGDGANVTISGGIIDATGGSGYVDVGVMAYNVAIGAGSPAVAHNGLTLEGGVVLEVKGPEEGAAWQDYDGSTRYYQMRTKTT